MARRSIGEEYAERDALAADMEAQEHAAAPGPRTPVLLDKWVRVTHPEHGEPVVFVPGERAPDWLVGLLPSGVPDPDDKRVIIVP